MSKTPLQPGNVVFIDGWAQATVDCIAMRQRRGMCAHLNVWDGSGKWVEVSRIMPLTRLPRAWEVREE